MCLSLILPWLEKTQPQVLKCWNIKILAHNTCFRLAITSGKTEKREILHSTASLNSFGITKLLCETDPINLRRHHGINLSKFTKAELLIGPHVLNSSLLGPRIAEISKNIIVVHVWELGFELFLKNRVGPWL